MNDRNIVVEKSLQPYVEDQKVEIVERKGIGHPDSLSDGISEAVSRALSQEYLNRFGNILHHNTDKVLIVGGVAEPEFGGGEIKKPIYIVIGGRGTDKVDDQEIPINKIAEDTTRKYLDEKVRQLDVEKHIDIDSRIGSGSTDLQSVFESQGIPSSNDTSLGVGYAPLSETEKLALKTEKTLNSREFKEKYPQIGEDIKVMVQREDGNRINLTVAVATICSFLDDLDHYLSLKEDLIEEIYSISSEVTEKQIEPHVNTADNPEKGVIYQTVTGTSAEQGDDGMTGRGNRTNGLITFDRPMSMEAAAGKNPINHVGKLYNLLSTEIAKEVQEIDGVREVFVRTASQIGKPIDQPKILNIRILPEREKDVKKYEAAAKSIAEDHLDNIPQLSEKIIEGKLEVF